jgi:hypothetical protein
MATLDLPHIRKSPVDLSSVICNTTLDPWGCVDFPLLDLELAAKAGCQLCSLRLCSITAFVSSPGLLARLLYRKHQTNDHFYFFKVDNGTRPISLEMFTLPDAPESSLPFVNVRRGTADRCTTAYLAVLIKWLDDCTSNHECADIEAPLTKRVIDIGSSSVDNVRLYITKSEPSRYLALSHCWGGPGTSRVCTTKQNLCSHTGDIPETNLPQNYLDVISIARRLNVRYVWLV